jgi:Uma2 family endonuclease
MDMVSTRLLTAEDLLSMGEDTPYELIDGELIEVSPTSFESSLVTSQLAGYIIPFVRVNRLGWVTSAEGGIVLRRNPDTVVAPDIGFIRKDRFPVGQDPHKFLSVPPDLAVEVVSPSDSNSQTRKKLALYRSVGVPLIWIVEPKNRTVTVYEAGQPALVLRSGEMLTGGSILPGFQLSVDEIFASPLDD